MIKYNLKCENGHDFESWFSNSDEFEKLKKKKLLECIYCNTKKIKKSIMAPMISSVKTDTGDLEEISKNLQFQKKNLIRIRNFVEKNFDYVGKDFSKKAREVFYDKKSKKGFYGTTTKEERKELAEEGIDLLSIPWVNKDN